MGKRPVLCNIWYIKCYVAHFSLHNMLYNKREIYITRYIYPSGTQTCCWDVIYNNFSGYITCYITCKVLYSSFCCLYNRVRPVLGIIVFFLGYVGKNFND